MALFEKVGLFPAFTEACRASSEIGKAGKAYEVRDYELAFRTLKPIADADASSFSEPKTASDAARKAVLVVAAHLVGLMYFHGQGVAQDFDQGVFYFRKAAQLGHKDAIQYLGEVGLE